MTRRALVALVLWIAVPIAGTAQGPRPSGSVSGEVLTRDGVAAAAVRVFAVVAPPPDARPEDGTQYYEPPPPTASVLTNAQGRYRLAALPPGRYHIVAGILGEATYHPSTMTMSAATVVPVEAGAARTDVNIRLATPYGGRVRGAITPPPAAGTPEIAVLSGLRLQELLEVPVGADGAFEFGHVPRGSYLVSIFPTPPGMPSRPLDVGDDDVTALTLVRPTLRRLSGRVVVRNGPLPPALLAFSTPTSYVPAQLADDGAFTALVQPATQVAEVGGLPVGYALESVRRGNADVTTGVAVTADDVPDLIVTLRAPAGLPAVRGRLDPALAARAPGAVVELTGPVKGAIRGPVKADGTFEVPNVLPGLYTLRVPQLADVAPLPLVVTSAGADVTVSPQPR